MFPECNIDSSLNTIAVLERAFQGNDLAVRTRFLLGRGSVTDLVGVFYNNHESLILYS